MTIYQISVRGISEETLQKKVHAYFWTPSRQLAAQAGSMRHTGGNDPSHKFEMKCASEIVVGQYTMCRTTY